MFVDPAVERIGVEPERGPRAAELDDGNPALTRPAVQRAAVDRESRRRLVEAQQPALALMQRPR